jgi:predicted deacylase
LSILQKSKNDAGTTTMQFVLDKPDLGPWRDGNTGVEGVWQFDSGRPGRSVMVTALVHGNELCGAWALLALLEAHIRPDAGTLTLAFCNLAGFDRFDAANHDASRFVDEDLNRVWSDDKLTKLNPNTQERRRALELRPYVAQADWLLDLHSMHETGEPLLLTGLQARNLALARQLGTPRHIVVDAGHQDGVRMRDYGHFGLDSASNACALLVECGFHGDTSSRDVAIDMTARFLTLSGCVKQERIPADWLQLPPQNQIAVKVTDAVVAQSEGLRFEKAWQGLQNIPLKGTVLARDGEWEYATPYDNCTLVMPSLRQLRAGVTVVRLAQRVE